MEKLIQAARCALADLAGIMPEFSPDVDSHPGWRTMVDLYDALREAGSDVSEWTDRIESIRKEAIG